MNTFFIIFAMYIINNLNFKRMKKFLEKIANIQKDKILHFAVSYVLVHILSVALRGVLNCPFDAIGVAWAVSLFVVGLLLKEIIIDKERADSGDWLADVLGGTLSAIIQVIYVLTL